ncbi:hypothetical protein ACIBK9_12115 [Nonomuraea sp. NPDC050227]
MTAAAGISDAADSPVPGIPVTKIIAIGRGYRTDPVSVGSMSSTVAIC